uniref:sulfate anion transporter 1-like isoform X1 n=1 Tax=Styela clava TaxID=7725 RepID=UPI0019393E7D|nr:sulfate anion transporter 1-like isoform X1 [Styela clava]
MSNGIFTRRVDNDNDVTQQPISLECDLDAKYRKRECKLEVDKQLRKRMLEACTCNGRRLKTFLRSIFPILIWLPKYDVKNNLLGDIAAGLTVGVVHIPQGLAYGLLATLPPIVGIYVSFFPVILYPIFGTSRHISMGTFAVISILISGVLDQRVPASFCGDHQSILNISSSNSTDSFLNESTTVICHKLYQARKVEVASALAVSVGLLQVIMYLFNLGLVTVFLSDSLVSGFVSGASIHVITSQIPKLVGVTVRRFSGPLALVHTYIDIFRNITTANWATIVISSVAIVFLVAGKEFNSKYKKKLPLPIPWELGIVILATAASYFGQFEEGHKVVTVGEVPTGISPIVPGGADVVSLFFDAIPLAIVAFTVEISLCQIFATKHAYEVHSNQELLALGICNIFGAFFSCFPSAASLSRSVIYEEIGGKTQLGAYISSAVVLAVLLWIGPLFQPLPQAALAVIIIVNIKSIAFMWKNVKPLWRISRLDAITWMVAWFSVVLLGVGVGLIVGFAFSIFTVILRTRNATGVQLQKLRHENVYRDCKKYITSTQHDEIFIYQFTSPLYFVNKDRFAKQLYAQLGFDPIKEFARKKSNIVRSKFQKKRKTNNKDDVSLQITSNNRNKRIMSSVNGDGNHRYRKNSNASDVSASEVDELMSSVHSVISQKAFDPAQKYSHVIFDMKQSSFIDSDGAKLIRELYDSFCGLHITLMLTSCCESVKQTLRSVWEDRDSALYISLDVAVHVAMSQQQSGHVLTTFSEHQDIGTSSV